jgi:hypothetical protein
LQSKRQHIAAMAVLFRSVEGYPLGSGELIGNLRTVDQVSGVYGGGGRISPRLRKLYGSESGRSHGAGERR